LAPAYYYAESSNYETAYILVELGRSILVQCLCWAYTASYNVMTLCFSIQTKVKMWNQKAYSGNAFSAIFILLYCTLISVAVRPVT